MRFDLDLDGQGDGFKFFTSRVLENGEIVYDEPGPDAATFYIRPMGPKIEELQAARKRRAEFVLNPATKAMERVSFSDESPAQLKQDREDTWDYCLTGWDDKALDGAGTPIPVTRENKLKLMRLPVFDRFFARCLQLLSAAGVKAQEAAEANLSRG